MLKTGWCQATLCAGGQAEEEEDGNFRSEVQTGDVARVVGVSHWKNRGFALSEMRDH